MNKLLFTNRNWQHCPSDSGRDFPAYCLALEHSTLFCFILFFYGALFSFDAQEAIVSPIRAPSTEI